MHAGVLFGAIVVLSRWIAGFNRRNRWSCRNRQVQSPDAIAPDFTDSESLCTPLCSTLWSSFNGKRTVFETHSIREHSPKKLWIALVHCDVPVSGHSICWSWFYNLWTTSEDEKPNDMARPTVLVADCDQKSFLRKPKAALARQVQEGLPVHQTVCRLDVRCWTPFTVKVSVWNCQCLLNEHFSLEQFLVKVSRFHGECSQLPIFQPLSIDIKEPPADSLENVHVEIARNKQVCRWLTAHVTLRMTARRAVIRSRLPEPANAITRLFHFWCGHGDSQRGSVNCLKRGLIEERKAYFALLFICFSIWKIKRFRRNSLAYTMCGLQLKGSWRETAGKLQGGYGKAVHWSRTLEL